MNEQADGSGIVETQAVLRHQPQHEAFSAVGHPNSRKEGEHSNNTMTSQDEDVTLFTESTDDQDHTLKEKFLEVWFRYSCLEPEDDFGQVMRKSSATLHLLMSPGPFAFGLYFVKIGFFPNDPPEDESSLLGAKSTAIFGPLWTFHAMLPYIVLRWKRHITTQFSDMHIVGHVLCLLFCTVFYPACLVQALTIATAILAILNQTKYEAIHCFVLSIVFAIVSFNRTYLGTGHELTVPGAYTGNPLENAINAVVCGTVVFVGIAGVFPQSIANRKHIAAAKAAVTMCARVVSLLRRYDTEGVKNALDEYHESGVDPELVSSLKMMNANLESYRPFLPNYLFQEDEKLTPDASEDAPIVGGVGGRYASNVQQTDITSEGSLSTIFSSSHSCTTAVDVESNTTTSTLPDATGPPPTGPLERRQSGLAATGPRSVFEGNITLVLVEVPQFHAAKKIDHVAVATSFVELIYAAADQFKASVHSMAGTVATITWNVTHRVPQPEVKAIRFLNHIRRHQSSIKFGGAAFSGPATCYSVTTAGKQHATVVSAHWMPMLNTAFTLACHHKCMLMDERTEMASAHHFGSLFVDRVALLDVKANIENLVDEPAAILIASHCHPDNFPPTHTRTFLRATSLFELLHEVVVEETEWMYQLQSKEEKQSGASLLRGAASEMLELMTEVLGSQSACSPRSEMGEDCRKLHAELKVVATKAWEAIKLVEELPPSTADTNNSTAGDGSLIDVAQLPLFSRLKYRVRSIRYLPDLPA